MAKSLQTGPIPAESIRAQLEKVLASEPFAQSHQLQCFLRFTVEQTLAGQSDQIKEYVIATEVFGRGDSFDSRIDPIVRVQAGKLRSRLEKYYATDGRDEPILFVYPKGTYVPVFSRREPVTPPGSPSMVANSKLSLKLGLAAAVLVLASLAAWWLGAKHRFQGEHGGAINSIAVLPFVNMSGDSSQDYFCEGMTEELINALAKVEGLHVVARTTTSQYKGKGEDIRTIGRQLNVAAVLEGSVRRSGDRLRITVQLNSVTNGYHLWSEIYDRKISEVFAIQEDISQAIVNRLRGNLPSIPAPPFVKRYTDNLEVYDLYLKGRYQLSVRNQQGVRIAIGYFEQALARDAGYAPAYAGLAEAHYLLMLGNGMPPKEALSKARDAAQKALALDQGLAEAHAALALVLWAFDRDWPGADREFRRALELRPNNAAIHWGYARYFEAQGRAEDALRESRRAADLDTLSLIFQQHAARMLIALRRYDEGIEQLRRILAIDPGFGSSYVIMGFALHGKKMYPEAREAFERASSLSARNDPQSLAALGNFLAEMGERAEAEKVLTETLLLSKRRYVPAMHIALIYAGLGNKDQLFEWLNRAVDQHDLQLTLLSHDQRLDAFRSDPRFTAALKRMRLQ